MKYRLLFTVMLLLQVRQALSQSEHIYVQLNRYIAQPKDTIWFKGFVSKEQHIGNAVSTNLYTELVSEHGVIIRKEMFPIFKGLSIGQIIIPDSLLTGNYY